MTETVTEKPAEVAAAVWEPTDAVSKAIVAELNEKAAEHNALQNKVDAATGDNSALIADLRGTSENPKVREGMQKYDDLIMKAEKILAQVDDLIKSDLAESAEMSEEDITKANETLKSFRDDIQAGVKYLARKYGDEVKSALTPLAGGKSSKSGAGEGSAKPRLKGVFVNGDLVSETVKVKQTVKGVTTETGETKVVSTFTLAAKKIPGATVQSLTEAYLATAKVKNWQDAPNIVEFSVKGSDDKNYMVRATK